MDRLFGKASKVLSEKVNEEYGGGRGVVVQRMIAMSDEARTHYLAGREEKADVFCLEDGYYERRPQLLPDGESIHGFNLRGYAFELAENAICAILNGRIGRSESYAAAYTLGRQDGSGALAFAIYNNAMPLSGEQRLKVDRTTYIKPLLIYSVAVCSKEGSMTDREIAETAIPVLAAWCKERNLIFVDQMVDMSTSLG